MPNPDDLNRLRHMLDAAGKAVAFVQGRQRSDLESDDMLALALVRLLEILGEAARQVTERFRDENPHIPWRPMIAVRNRLIHGYLEVDPDIIWRIVNDDLPPLIDELENLIASDRR